MVVVIVILTLVLALRKALTSGAAATVSPTETAWIQIPAEAVAGAVDSVASALLKSAKRSPIRLR